MKDISIEYSHIYTNQKIDKEHHLSLQILGELKKEAEARQQSVSLTILIDDYSFPDSSFDYATFLQWLKLHDQVPDVVYKEAQLIPQCDEVIELITNQKLRAELSNYINSKRYPCSLFIAAWYLLRLGYLKSVDFNESNIAKDLINVLPSSFKEYEDKGIEIIKATPFAQATQHISYRFIEGRALS